MEPRVVIDLGPPCRRRFGADDAVVVVDVIRSMTTAVTAVALGARCLLAPAIDRARAWARVVPRPLLVGELHGLKPPGFDHDNSPSQLAGRTDLAGRSVILLSTSGTPLVDEVRRAGAVYAGCLRNPSALAAHLARTHRRVALVGAATRGEFREEDQLLCARIAARLIDFGFAVEDEATAAIVTRFADAPLESMLVSRSVAFLERTRAIADLDFILDHVDDLDAVHRLQANELHAIKEGPCASTLRSSSSDSTITALSA
jgi:2-phosphosulfolactate phosphatase